MYTLYYCSEDATGTWSVYSEKYPNPDTDAPIDGTQSYVSTHPDEATADSEASRLQALANVEPEVQEPPC